MASRPFPNLAPGFGRNALDLPVAGLAAIAVAFAAFAMPGDLMARLVEASGLPSLLSAAAPPLGMKARIGVGLIGAVGAFGIVFVLLRLLDRTGIEPRRRRVVAEFVEVDEEEAPRVRRRDFHPDAPSPRPISAIREFGEPAPPQPPISALWPEAPEPSGWDDEEPLELNVEPEFEAPAELRPEPEIETFPVSERPFEPEPEPFATLPEPAQESSLDALMARLEQGLARRARPAAQAAPAPVQAPPTMPQAFPEAGDDRLQSAIESLQRFAARE